MQSQAFHTGRSPVPPLPPTLVRGTTLCLAALVSSAGDSLGVSRRKLPRHGPTRLHHDPAEAYMRPVLELCWVAATFKSCGRPTRRNSNRTRNPYKQPAIKQLTLEEAKKILKSS